MSCSANFRPEIVLVSGRLQAGVLRALALLLGALALVAGCGASKQPPLRGARIDRIVIVKSAHTMTLMEQGRVLKVYKVVLGR